MISHQNVCVLTGIHILGITEKDRHISYLPMAHVLERMAFLCVLYYGGRIGVWSGNKKLLPEDMSILKPTIFVSVPRIFNKMYEKMQAKLGKSNFLVKSLVNRAINTKLETLHS